MQCPKCGSKSSKVLTTYPTKFSVRRRRECLAYGCTNRWTTMEFVVVTGVTTSEVGVKYNGE